MSENIVEKIRKLLALAADAEDHEAHAALLKARALMAQHKLSEHDVRKSGAPRELNRVHMQDQTYSGLKNIWKSPLSVLIAEHHCCASISSHVKGSSVFFLSFVGLDDDPRLAEEIFRYAVDHIEAMAARERIFINREYADQSMRNAVMRVWAASYPSGFIRGLREQYAQQFRQQENSEYALALVLPKEVTDYQKSLSRATIKVREIQRSQHYTAQGYNDGKAFQPRNRIDNQPAQLKLDV